MTITIMFLELLHAYGLVAKKAVDVRFSFILQSRMAGIARKGKGALKLESIRPDSISNSRLIFYDRITDLFRCKTFTLAILRRTWSRTR